MHSSPPWGPTNAVQHARHSVARSLSEEVGFSAALAMRTHEKERGKIPCVLRAIAHRPPLVVEEMMCSKEHALSNCGAPLVVIRLSPGFFFFFKRAEGKKVGVRIHKIVGTRTYASIWFMAQRAVLPV
jgi:hypothetical protein